MSEKNDGQDESIGSSCADSERDLEDDDEGGHDEWEDGDDANDVAYSRFEPRKRTRVSSALAFFRNSSTMGAIGTVHRGNADGHGEP